MLATVTQSLTSWWAPALAFVAGFVSFASPCCFPLMPGYLSFIAGESASGVVATTTTRTRLLPMALFVGGFTLVFTLFGAFSSTFVRLFRGSTGQFVMGAIVVVFGVVMILYAYQRGPMAIYTERRPFLEKVNPGVAGAFPLGMAFAAGWTPCLGPVLSGIIGIASTQSAGRAALLMVFYSLGLAVPFVVIGLGVMKLTSTFAWFRRHYKAIALVSGALLILVGVLLMTGTFTRVLMRPFSGGTTFL
ncbi:MAG: cytochrome c biogenesis protein CcdA [Planctomycetaceae bacterium]